MAHKKAGGSTCNGRDSVSKRLGVKCFGGEAVKAGNIIVRQPSWNCEVAESVLRAWVARPLVLHKQIPPSLH